MQAYLAVPQGRLMPKLLQRRRPVPVYVWNADQDVCLAAFLLEYHELLERQHNDPLLRWIVQFNNKIDVGGGHAFGRVIRLENARRPATGDGGRRIWCPARDKQDCVALRPHTIQQDRRRHSELDPRRWGSVQVDGKGFKGDGTR